ncbi:MAG: hypothetical protein KC777_26300, partial [Cyanobacteria bacterium HKST-UBA02]|nr:hypothetical protein [Cyanobacteria bacterium HKST-UBA02]
MRGLRPALLLREICRASSSLFYTRTNIGYSRKTITELKKLSPALRHIEKLGKLSPALRQIEKLGKLSPALRQIEKREKLSPALRQIEKREKLYPGLRQREKLMKLSLAGSFLIKIIEVRSFVLSVSIHEYSIQGEDLLRFRLPCGLLDLFG